MRVNNIRYASIHGSVQRLENKKYANYNECSLKTKKKRKKVKTVKQSPQASMHYSGSMMAIQKSPEPTKRKSSIYMSAKNLGNSVYDRRFGASPCTNTTHHSKSKVFTIVANTDGRLKENRKYTWPPSFYQLEQSSRNDDSVIQSYQGLISPTGKDGNSQVLRSLRNVTSKPNNCHTPINNENNYR